MLAEPQRPKSEASKRGRRVPGDKLRISKYPIGIKARKFAPISRSIDGWELK
jgi:hypothetical protein